MGVRCNRYRQLSFYMVVLLIAGFWILIGFSILFKRVSCCHMESKALTPILWKWNYEFYHMLVHEISSFAHLEVIKGTLPNALKVSMHFGSFQRPTWSFLNLMPSYSNKRKIFHIWWAKLSELNAKHHRLPKNFLWKGYVTLTWLISLISIIPYCNSEDFTYKTWKVDVDAFGQYIVHLYEVAL